MIYSASNLGLIIHPSGGSFPGSNITGQQLIKNVSLTQFVQPSNQPALAGGITHFFWGEIEKS